MTPTGWSSGKFVYLPPPSQCCHLQVFAPASSSPHMYQPRCHGVDFWLHNQMPEVDATLAGGAAHDSRDTTWTPAPLGQR